VQREGWVKNCRAKVTLDATKAERERERESEQRFHADAAAKGDSSTARVDPMKIEIRDPTTGKTVTMTRAEFADFTRLQSQKAGGGGGSLPTAAADTKGDDEEDDEKIDFVRRKPIATPSSLSSSSLPASVVVPPADLEPPTLASKTRTAWYQMDQHVTIDVFAKDVPRGDVNVEILADSVRRTLACLL
jgi:hypothetical protein